MSHSVLTVSTKPLSYRNLLFTIVGITDEDKTTLCVNSPGA